MNTINKSNITYISNDENLKTDNFLKLANKVWPRNFNKELTAKALKKTINFTAYYENSLIGCVRILTDGYFFGTITEILVDPRFQKMGVGKTLMELMWKSSPTSLFFGAQEGNELFFEKLGFEKSMQSYSKRKKRKE